MENETKTQRQDSNQSGMPLSSDNTDPDKKSTQKAYRQTRKKDTNGFDMHLQTVSTNSFTKHFSSHIRHSTE